jgi:hypothetical protein
LRKEWLKISLQSIRLLIVMQLIAECPELTAAELKKVRDNSVKFGLYHTVSGLNAKLPACIQSDSLQLCLFSEKNSMVKVLLNL